MRRRYPPEYQRRRDVLARGLHEAGWMVAIPKRSMYIWAEIQSRTRQWARSSLRRRCWRCQGAVSHGMGYGDYGDRSCALRADENEHRVRQAVRGIKEMFRKDGRVATEPSSCLMVGRRSRRVRRLDL